MSGFHAKIALCQLKDGWEAIQFDSGGKKRTATKQNSVTEDIKVFLIRTIYKKQTLRSM